MRFGSLGPTELILIALILVLIFGASKLGDIGGALGKSVREFKKAQKDEEAEAARREEEAAAVRAETPVVTEKTTTTATTVATAEPEKAPSGLGDYRPPDQKAS